MKLNTARPALTAALLTSAAPAVATTPHDTSRPSTPNTCIKLNRGEWNACNSGAGNLPYLVSVR